MSTRRSFLIGGARFAGVAMLGNLGPSILPSFATDLAATVSLPVGTRSGNVRGKVVDGVNIF